MHMNCMRNSCCCCCFNWCFILVFSWHGTINHRYNHTGDSWCTSNEITLIIVHSPISIAVPLAHVRDLGSYYYPYTHSSLKKLHIHQVLMTVVCLWCPSFYWYKYLLWFLFPGSVGWFVSLKLLKSSLRFQWPVGSNWLHIAESPE